MLTYVSGSMVLDGDLQGGMLTFSAIRLKLEISKMSYCTLNITSLVNTDSTILMAKDGLHMHKQCFKFF